MVRYNLISLIRSKIKRHNKVKTKLEVHLERGNITLGRNTILDSANIEIRSKNFSNKEFVKIGDDSLISGNYYFETEEGKITIGNRTFIGASTFVCVKEIEIGDDVMFAWGCTVVDNDSHSIYWEDRKNDVLDWKKGIEEKNIGLYKNWNVVKKEKISIKDKAWIGFNSIILKGITVGEGAVVGAGSVVTKDVPDYTVVAGNPAKIIRKIEH